MSLCFSDSNPTRNLGRNTYATAAGFYPADLCHHRHRGCNGGRNTALATRTASTTVGGPRSPREGRKMDQLL